MHPFCRFMSSATGRGIRMAAGIALIIAGIWFIAGTTGTIVAVLGFVPLLAGTFNLCLIGPLFGCPIRAGKT